MIGALSRLPPSSLFQLEDSPEELQWLGDCVQRTLWDHSSTAINFTQIRTLCGYLVRLRPARLEMYTTTLSSLLSSLEGEDEEGFATHCKLLFAVSQLQITHR